MSPGALRIGRIFGIEVRLHPSWVVIFLLVTVQLAIIGAPNGQAQLPPVLRVILAAVVAALFFASVLAHELGHALVARRCGVQVDEILLFVFGGSARLEQEAPSPRVELVIGLAGPIVNLVLGVVCLVPWVLVATSVTDDTASDVVIAIGTLAFWVGVSNLVLAVINLLPAFPLDGGRILRALAWAVTRDFVRATRIASVVGRVMGWSLVGAGIVAAVGYDVLVGLWIILIGWFLGQAAEGGYRRVAVERLVKGLRVSDVMLRDYPVVTQNLTLDTLEQQTDLADALYFPVVLDGNLAGAVDLKSIRRIPRGRRATTRVADVMRHVEALATVHELDPLWDAVLRFDASQVDGLPVVDPSDPRHLIGLVTRDSVFKTLRLRRKAEAAGAAADG
ncbi:MAG TPA: site-2 protease family protein [Candidatus Sulfotelmatobacter sp.]|nr:site-2 protease family protein [Candidatus Sulfotelmatobacter sp.]